jgi:hypothetical protein
MWRRRAKGDLSDAVVVFLQHYPSSNLEAFTARFPQPDTQTHVQSLLHEAIQVPEHATTLSLQQIGAQVRTVMRERHPELSDEALHRLGNYVTYLMR